MRYLLVTLYMLGFLDAPIAWGVDCKVHKIYCKIVELQPAIDKTFAMELSNKISRKAKTYNIDPMVSLAILNQESSLRNINTFSVNKKVTKTCDTKGCTKLVIEEYEVVDMTMAQINISTALHLNFDVNKLFNLDLDYALECHYKILNAKIKRCKNLGSEAWSCYHSVTPKHREKYVQLVSRFL